MNHSSGRTGVEKPLPAGLNPQQHDAAVYAGERPLLIIAGAGSGKTNTLAHRVARLVEGGAAPAEVLLLTFSRRAAQEMVRRVERLLLGPRSAFAHRLAASLVWAGTFHAVGARLLREFAPRIGVSAAFSIHDREDSADLMNLVRQDSGFSSVKKRFPLKGTCLAIYSRVVNSEEPLPRVLAGAFPWCREWEGELRTLFAAYVEAKQQQNVLDYDDLLLYWCGMLRDPSIASELDARFRHILVDEYQDTNPLQSAILQAMKPSGRGLTVVGDDAQSIYAFRGATVRNILDFPRSFPAPAQVITLEHNYRSSQPILDAANAVIALASERFTKNLISPRSGGTRPRLVTLADEAAQARYVVEDILASREAGVALRNQAVLFRASHHSVPLELELARRDVPFVKFGGLKFLEAAHVKDLLACLRWAENPRDRVAGFRALQLTPGIGPKTAVQILDRIAGSADPVDALGRVASGREVDQSWTDFVALVGALVRRAVPWPVELAAVRNWYEPVLVTRYEDALSRVGDLQALENIAATYPSRERFITELTLDPPNATSDFAADPVLDDDFLILSTIHSAKGQEWNAVTILNGVDGCMPSDLSAGAHEEIEEERRLLYVAMTRAKDHLQLIIPQRFYVSQQIPAGDRHVYANRTRFIPSALEPLFECLSWPHRAGDPSATELPAAPVTNVAARMRAMWR
jgi:ATP-dependent DNA helicase UvrD/PcrA